ncbi:hypothetical protein ACEPAI_3504 [Sanghuangporus weigelae]
MDPHDHDRERVERIRAPRNSSRSPSTSAARIPHGPSTSLPSIRNLHLPPSRHAAPAQQHSPSEFLPGSSYGPPGFFAGTQRSPALASAYPAPAYEERRMSFDRSAPGGWTQPPSSTYPEQHISPPEAESDQDQNESEHGPPKKKRRRQALSCTECKRRKIKCDRAHPCGPCARRSEPDKCQWHVIEPVDKYVTRSEWDELYTRYRMLEDRCIRLEKLVVQLHPELTEYEAGAGYSITVSSSTTQRPVPSRLHPLAGSAIPGPGADSRGGNQHIIPNTPLSALPGPGPGPRHGPGSAIPAPPVGSSIGADNSASSRSGSAPPPVHPTAQTAVPHLPTRSDRRTSASGSRASFSAASERPVLHQVSEAARGRPFTAPSPHSYTFRPPPPPPENPPSHLLPRSHSGFTQGRSSAVPESSSTSSPRMYATRPSGRSYPSPLSAVSTGRHMPSDKGSPESTHEEPEGRYSSRYSRDTAHERSMEFERPDPDLRRRDTESKNEEAQTSEADDALRLRHNRSASLAYQTRRSFLSNRFTTDEISVSASSFTFQPKLKYARSDGSVSPSPRFQSPEVPPNPQKRPRLDSLYLNVPSCGSVSETSPPALAVH